ncbi:MAG: VapC toxin family PIN domain ribonuclease [Bifidobacteriaceae bacterium]|jgi:predicted nucleic acid-binding protein|nr:VapC toxin family PIN domain ribonuclease [Bifidobacteriaceae bacterium]
MSITNVPPCGSLQRGAAVCPVVEGALFRYLLRAGRSTSDAQALVRAFGEAELIEFWPDDLSYGEIPVGHLRGHKQATDAYLAALAAGRGGQLATLDEGLASQSLESVTLVP